MDLWLQHTKEENTETLRPAHWNDRKVTAYLDQRYVQTLLQEQKKDYDTSHAEGLIEHNIPEDQDPEEAVETYGETLLPTKFRIPKPNSKNHSTLELQQSYEGLTENYPPEHLMYKSQGVESVEDHLGLAGIAETWFQVFNILNPE